MQFVCLPHLYTVLVPLSQHVQILWSILSVLAYREALAYL